MRALLCKLTQLSIKSSPKTTQFNNLSPLVATQKSFSTQDERGGKSEPDWAAHFGGTESSGPDTLGWDTGASSWSTGLTKEHFDGEVIGQQVGSDSGQVQPGAARQGKPRQGNLYSNARWTDQEMQKVKELEAANRKGKGFVEGWDDRMHEITGLMRQVREPGARGSYLKDSEKAEMYKKHKENPEVYTVERLAKEYRIMRQRVHAILWLKELEEEEEKKLGHPLDDSVELLLDTCPEFFNSHDREFHVASLPYKPDFKVMPEGWDGTTRDPDEVHYEISMKEDEMLYQEFVQRMNFNKMKMANKVKCHKYSRKRPDEGWTFTVEKLGPRGKRGNGGGLKFISEPNGSSRPLNEFEKMFVKRETPRRRRKILP
ncbi:Translation initiation factor eIF-2B subunit gamma [Castilleja foliolosa]|uniref:Translation initiation factor eIF-2B subunit gamma n=1 Tax=Castilleja foliolosa TaxID=1961234 RepID=A0ABD3D1G1_9LAMI